MIALVLLTYISAIAIAVREQVAAKKKDLARTKVMVKIRDVEKIKAMAKAVHLV